MRSPKQARRMAAKARRRESVRLRDAWLNCKGSAWEKMQALHAYTYRGRHIVPQRPLVRTIGQVINGSIWSWTVPITYGRP
jgi:hypothetical protein